MKRSVCFVLAVVFGVTAPAWAQQDDVARLRAVHDPLDVNRDIH